MKKVITFILGVSLCLAATAQQQHARKHELKGNKNANKEELAEKKCKAMVEKLMLDEAVSAKFIPLYKAYLNELGSNFAFKHMQKDTEISDADIDKQVKENFEKTRKMIDIREKYYNEFRGFLTAKQAKMAVNAHGEKGKKGEKRNFHKADGGEKKETMHKHLDFSHDKKRLNDSQTQQAK